MKKIFLATLAVIAVSTCFAQQITKITMATNGGLESISLAVDDNVIVNLTDEGSISKYGLEPFNLRTENYGDYTDKLDNYLGRVEYYTPSDNEAFRGKIKYIGKTLITYYASYDDEAMKGKIRTIGTSQLSYYQAFDDKAFQGKLKKIGGMELAYYSSFDNEALKGKLRSIGISNITYYSSFDDKLFAGKVKSIANSSYTYYSSFDRPEYRGARKSGNQIQYINGIKFYVK